MQHPENFDLQRAQFGKILIDQKLRYPLMEIQDYYKLLYQAAMGSEHAILNEDVARRRLEQEAAELSKDVRVPEVEQLSPDGIIVRVNLRPYLLAGGDISRLFDAFVKTSKEFQGDERNLELYAKWVLELADADEIGLSQVEFAEFFEQRRRHGHSAVHHSAVYKEAYHPAYRVVARRFLRR